MNACSSPLPNKDNKYSSEKQSQDPDPSIKTGFLCKLKKYNYILQVEYIHYYKPTNRIFILRSYNRGITRYEFKIDRAVQPTPDVA